MVVRKIDILVYQFDHILIFSSDIYDSFKYSFRTINNTINNSIRWQHQELHVMDSIERTVLRQCINAIFMYLMIIKHIPQLVRFTVLHKLFPPHVPISLSESCVTRFRSKWNNFDYMYYSCTCTYTWNIQRTIHTANRNENFGHGLPQIENTSKYWKKIVIIVLAFYLAWFSLFHRG